MPTSPADPVTISIDSGVVMARITASAVEEREATGILNTVKAAIDDAGTDLRFVVLDFEGVDFINSSGLAACVELRNGADAHGAATVVYRAKQDVDAVFKMVKLDRLYVFVHSTDELAQLVTP
jgi:anti-anti-sigma factor